jgi:hypothetical protein
MSAERGTQRPQMSGTVREHIEERGGLLGLSETAVSRGEGELLTVPKPRAVGLLPVCPTVKPVGESDALIGHVRFDERG